MLDKIKKGDIVAVCTLYEGINPAKVIRETKKYLEVSLKNLPDGHSARYSSKGTLDSQMYYRPTGVKKGANDPVSLHYCPDYIIPLDKAIEDMEKDLEETKDDHGLEDYRKEVAENLEKCKKAKIEGVQC